VDAESAVAFTVAPLKPTLACGDTVIQSVTLNVDLDCTGVGLTIAADDITLDLGNHTITGGNIVIGNSPVPRVDDRHDILVRNGTVVQGFDILGASRVRLDHLNVGVGGINIGAYRDLTISATTVIGGDVSNRKLGDFPGDTVKIAGSTFANSSLALLTGAFDIENCTFTDSSIHSNQGPPDTIAGSILTNTGVSFYTDTTSETIVRNTITGGTGVYLDGSNVHAVVTDNTFSHGDVGLAMDVIAAHDSLVTRNTFRDNDTAGLLLYVVSRCDVCSGPLLVRGNHFIDNGSRSNGKQDSAGRTINDGLHADIPPPSHLTITGNETVATTAYGIEAPLGTVADGGGNTSADNGNPQGCLGVTCS